MEWYFIILIIIGVILFIDIYTTIRSYIKSKILKLNAEKNKILEVPKKTISMTDKINTTLDIINLIIFLINYQISYKLKEYAELHKPYPILNADDDLLNILEEIQKALKIEIFTSDEILLSDEYLMKYITGQTTILWIRSIVDFNSEIKRGNNEIQ